MRAHVLAISLSALVLTGCALQPTASQLSVGSGPTSNAAFTGKAFGGQQPITGSVISVYQVGGVYGAGALLKASTTTDSNGTFSFPANSYTCAKPTTPMYIVAIGGNPGGVPAGNPNIGLIASLGACSVATTETVILNEVTTAATVFALGQFMNTTLGSGVVPQIGGQAAGDGTPNRGLVAAMNNTVPSLVSLALGTANTTAVVNGVTIIRESAKLNTVANVLAACINSAGQTSLTDTTSNCGSLNNLTNATGAATRPYNTIQAALMMDLYPYNQVSSLYNLASASPPFVGLGAVPNDWTLAVAYATSKFGVGINGTATSRTSMSLDIDTTQRIWFPSTKSGASGLGYFDPATLTFNGPYGSAYLTHPQYVAIDESGIAWSNDLNTNSLAGVSTTAPTTVQNYTLPVANASLQTVFLNTSNSVQVPYGVGTKDFDVAQLPSGTTTFNPLAVVETPLAVTATGGYGEQDTINYYAASGSKTPCYIVTNPYGATGYTAFTTTLSSQCFSGGMTENGYNVGGGTVYGATPVMTTSDNNVCYYNFFGTTGCTSPAATLNAPEGIATDGADNLWIANSGNGSITTMGGAAASFADISPVSYIHDTNHGGTLSTPYALGIDGAGNVWTVSASCVTTSATACIPTGMTLTELVGAAAPTNTPLNHANVYSTFGLRPTN